MAFDLPPEVVECLRESLARLLAQCPDDTVVGNVEPIFDFVSVGKDGADIVRPGADRDFTIRASGGVAAVISIDAYGDGETRVVVHPKGGGFDETGKSERDQNDQSKPVTPSHVRFSYSPKTRSAVPK